MTLAERAELDALFGQIEDDNRARYAAQPKPTAKQVTEMAAFLRGWARRKPIIKVGGDGNSFWKCGSRMTQLQPKMVAALVAAGHATPDGGEVLTMVFA
jgi:hypothetical protein